MVEKTGKCSRRLESVLEDWEVFAKYTSEGCYAEVIDLPELLRGDQKPWGFEVI